MGDITRTVLDSDGLILRVIRVVLRKVWNNEDIVHNPTIKMLLDTWKPNQVKQKCFFDDDIECILEQTPQLSQVSILIRQDPTIQIQTNVSNTPPYLASSISSGTLSIFIIKHIGRSKNNK